MSVRKVQLTGKSSLIVSLPKKWTEKVDLKPKDSLIITELKGGALKLVPSSRVSKAEKPLESQVKLTSEMEPETLARQVIANYLVGYDFVRVTAVKKGLIGTAHRNAVRETVNELIGMEIIEHSAKEIVIQSLLDYSKLSISTVIEKMHKISVSMQEDSVNALVEGNLDLARDVIIRDPEVDRLYLLAVKQLKDMIRNEEIAKTMGVNVRACLGFRVVVKCIERMADHSERIARNVIVLGRPILPVSVNKDLVEMNKTACKVHTLAIQAILFVDGKMAEEAIQLIKSVEDTERKVIQDLVKESFESAEVVCTIRSIVESLRRTADYGTDIAEIALNLAAGEPEL